jgi:hypothetical protein
MNDGRRFTVRPTSSLASEQDRDARVRAWAYAFECSYRRVGKVHNPDEQEQFVNKKRRTK